MTGVREAADTAREYVPRLIEIASLANRDHRDEAAAFLPELAHSIAVLTAAAERADLAEAVVAQTTRHLDFQRARAEAAEAKAATLEAALADEIEMMDQAVRELRSLKDNWLRIIDQNTADGEPLIEEMLRSVIDDITASEAARAALAAAGGTAGSTEE